MKIHGRNYPYWIMGISALGFTLSLFFTHSILTVLFAFSFLHHLIYPKLANVNPLILANVLMSNSDIHSFNYYLEKEKMAS